MGAAANITENPGNPETDDLIRQPDFTVVTAIPDQTAEVAAGTGYLCEINRKNNFIIKFLRNRVAEINMNGYHSIVHGVSHVFGDGGRTQALVGESPAFCFIVTDNYNSTKSPRIKQFDG